MKEFTAYIKLAQTVRKQRQLLNERKPVDMRDKPLKMADKTNPATWQIV